MGTGMHGRARCRARWRHSGMRRATRRRALRRRRPPGWHWPRAAICRACRRARSCGDRSRPGRRHPCLAAPGPSTRFTFSTALQHALAGVARGVAVAQFDGFVAAGGCARRHAGFAPWCRRPARLRRTRWDCRASPAPPWRGCSDAQAHSRSNTSATAGGRLQDQARGRGRERGRAVPASRYSAGDLPSMRASISAAEMRQRGLFHPVRSRRAGRPQANPETASRPRDIAACRCGRRNDFSAR